MFEAWTMMRHSPGWNMTAEPPSPIQPMKPSRAGSPRPLRCEVIRPTLRDYSPHSLATEVLGATPRDCSPYSLHSPLVVVEAVPAAVRELGVPVQFGQRARQL